MLEVSPKVKELSLLGCLCDIAVSRTNTDKLYEELGWEIFYYMRWYRRLCHFYKLRNDQRPLYLFSEIPQERTLHYSLCRPIAYEPNVKSTEQFSHTYFQNYLGEWNQLDETIKNSPTVSVFKVTGDSLLIYAFAYSLFIGFYSVTSNMTSYFLT